MREFLQEAKRRNVTKVAFVYVIAGWLTMQVVDVMFPALQLPEWMTTAIAALLLIGFPFALIFAWAFELTPDGLKREKDVERSESITHVTGQKLNQSALIILAIAVGFLLFDKFVLRPDLTGQPPVEQSAEVTQTVKPSIAVLPFVNMSGDSENEYFSDGLSEELLNLLAKIPQLHVAGRTSSFAFKGQNEDLRTIGERLNVAHILEGSVRKSDMRLRITAQLIDTDNGYHLWSETYDRELTDIFAVQDEISAAVVQALRVTLLGERITVDRGTENLDAYELYLKARYYVEHTSRENLQKAVDALDGAVQLDPEYANAWFLRALAELQQTTGWASEGSDFEAGYQRVRDFANRGIKAQPDSAESHFIRGIVAGATQWEFAAALQHLEEAVERNPSHLPAMGWYAYFLTIFGRFEEAAEVYEASLEIDPLWISNIRALGDTYLFDGNVDKAIETYESILALDPDISRVYGRLARAALSTGDIDAAAEYAAREQVDWARQLMQVIVLGRRGDHAAWRKAADEYAAKWGELNAYQNAEIYADGGDIEKAFEWLAVARRIRDPGAQISRVDPLLRPLHGDTRWAAHLEALGLTD